MCYADEHSTVHAACALWRVKSNTGKCDKPCIHIHVTSIHKDPTSHSMRHSYVRGQS